MRSPDKLPPTLDGLVQPAALYELSSSAVAVLDGRGLERLGVAMEQLVPSSAPELGRAARGILAS